MKAIWENARHVLMVIVTVFSVFLGITTYVSAVEYEYTELLPQGWSSASALGINDSGEVVGSISDGTTNKGFIYSAGAYTEIIPPGWTKASAAAINASGAVVGYGSNGTSTKGFLYSEGVYTEIIPPGWSKASAVAINASGAVVGHGSKGTSTKGFLYSEGVYTEIIPPGWSSAYAFSINASGAIAGYGSNGTSTKGFLYSEGVYTEIIPPGWSSAYAFSINASGEVAGYGSDGTTSKGFLYSEGVYTDIIPPAMSSASARSINASGEVVGSIYDGTTNKGFIYSAGAYTEIIPPGWDYTAANDINGNAVVVGSGYDGTGTGKGFIAAPIVVDDCPDDPLKTEPGVCGCGVSDVDTDLDEVPDCTDNCPSLSNSGQEDFDADGTGDLCDTDRDGDEVADDSDCAPDNATTFKTWIVYSDTDEDGYGAGSAITICGNDEAPVGYSTNSTDNCPDAANADQKDTDGDGIGDLCDTDGDGDNVADDSDCAPDDAASFKTWIVYADTDGDGYGTGSAITMCGNDVVPDGYSTNSTDNCPDAANADQKDTDGDGIGDMCEQAVDSDKDGISDSADSYPHSNMARWIIIRGCYTRVMNQPLADGATMNDLIDECSSDYKNPRWHRGHRDNRDHKAFLSCITKLTNDWKAQGLITNKEKSAIQRCADRAK